MAASSKDEPPIWSPGSQLQWFEGLAAEDLTNWLRRLIWKRSSYPLVPPSQSIPITYFANVMGRGTPALKSTIREVVPRLIQEWGRNDTTQCLDDLLVLAGLLKCAAAEKAIATIAWERITGRAEEVALRQRCLSVLSGFGCSEYTAPLFNRYLDDIDYSAYCFRALYKYKLSYAETTLPVVVATHKAAGKLPAFKGVLNLLLFDHLIFRQRVDLWKDIINSTKPKQLKEMLETLQSLGIVVSVQRTGEIEVIYDYKPKKPGEELPSFEYPVAAIAAIYRALEAFVTDSDNMTQAVTNAA